MNRGSFNRYEVYLFALIILAFFYNAYRYPLMMNSSETSPTYGDTPIYLQIGKYLIFAVIQVFMFFKTIELCRFIEITLWRLLVCLYLMIVPIIYGFAIGSAQLIETGYFAAVPVMLLLGRPGFLSYRRAAMVLHVLLCIYLIVNALQIVLAFIFGRMPALAYPGTLNIRFGSVLDDPNSFAIILSLFGGFAIHYYEKTVLVFMMAMIVISLMLTQSLTAIGSISLAAVIIYIKEITGIVNSNKIKSMIVSVIVIVSIILIHEKVYEIFKYKLESVLGHLVAFRVFSSISIKTIFGIKPTGMIYDSGYINFIINMGIQYLFVFIAVGIYTIRVLCKLRSCNVSREARAILSGGLLFVVSVMIGQFNLPYDQTFPVNIVYYIFIGLSMSGIFHLSAQVQDEK